MFNFNELVWKLTQLLYEYALTESLSKYTALETLYSNLHFEDGQRSHSSEGTKNDDKWK